MITKKTLPLDDETGRPAFLGVKSILINDTVVTYSCVKCLGNPKGEAFDEVQSFSINVPFGEVNQETQALILSFASGELDKVVFQDGLPGTIVNEIFVSIKPGI